MLVGENGENKQTIRDRGAIYLCPGTPGHLPHDGPLGPPNVHRNKRKAWTDIKKDLKCLISKRLGKGDGLMGGVGMGE